jgi:isoaspartyl peptidase/L-asparaginase-like protein (Ntn-hydrolase superfamily)
MIDARLLATWSFAARHCGDAWPDLAAGEDPLDVAIAVAAAVEADPEIDSVGRGGLPDADGEVALDALVMRSPSELGAVVGLRGRLPAVTAARAVMERTPHVMVAGAGAERLADAAGARAVDLLTDAARARWEAWRARRDGGGGADATTDEPPPRPIDRGRGALFEAGAGGHDTVCVIARGTNGRLAGACSTSGTPWKHPGRVGDSPIPGHGLYVHPDHGAASATGTGELAMGSCTSFLCVEHMRAGAGPAEAARLALERIIEDHELAPHHQLAVIAMAPDGTAGSAALRPDFLVVIADDRGLEVQAPDHVLIPGG